MTLPAWLKQLQNQLFIVFIHPDVWEMGCLSYEYFCIFALLWCLCIDSTAHYSWARFSVWIFFKNSFCMKVGSHWFQEAGNVLYDLNDYCDIAEEPSSKLIFVFSSDTVVSFHNLQMCLDVADLTPALVFISMQKRIWLVWLGYIITGPRYRFPCFGGPTEWVPSRTHSEGDEFHRNALFPLYLSKNWG